MKFLINALSIALAWSAAARADSPGVHGMLLFGNQVTYASHLPMFHSPHDYQVLLKLSLQDVPGSATVATYEAEKAGATEYFTLVPEVMDLTKVISGAKTAFSAVIFKGHFERGGKKLGPVKVQVEQIVFSAKLNGTHAPADNDYFVFGGAGEYFAAHVIQGKPNFDAILGVSQPYELKVTHCRTRVCAETGSTPVPDTQLPLTLSAPSNAEKAPSAGDSLGALSDQLADIQKVIYFEEGELAD